MENKFLCAICKKPTLMCCSGCKNVFYCSEAHQLEHWESHAAECVHEEESSIVSRSPSISDKSRLDPVPDNSLLADEEVYSQRYKLRKSIVESLASSSPSSVITEARPYFTRVLSEYDRNRYFDIYEVLTDGVLLAKAYIESDYLDQARQLLLQIYTRMQGHSGSHESSAEANFKIDESKGTKGDLTYNQLKKKLSVYSTLGNLLSICGDSTNAEKMYVQYLKLLELHLSNKSLEVSNAYFMVALFYQEKQFLQKALGAFMKSLDIRSDILGNDHETVSDCYYNIGVMHKQLGNFGKSMSNLMKALEIRVNNCSEFSLPVAQVYETIGSLLIHRKDYKGAYEKLSMCYKIRKELYKHNKAHPDIQRATQLLATLQKIIEDEETQYLHLKSDFSQFNPINTPEFSPFKHELFVDKMNRDSPESFQEKASDRSDDY